MPIALLAAIVAAVLAAMKIGGVSTVSWTLIAVIFVAPWAIVLLFALLFLGGAAILLRKVS